LASGRTIEIPLGQFRRLVAAFLRLKGAGLAPYILSCSSNPSKLSESEAEREFVSKQTHSLHIFSHDVTFLIEATEIVENGIGKHSIRTENLI